MRRGSLVALMAGVFVVLAMQTSFADPQDNHWRDSRYSSASNPGAWAQCDVYTDGSAIPDVRARIKCSLKDINQDGDAVYVAWWQDGYGHVSMYNRNGAGSTITVCDPDCSGTLWRTGDGSFGTIYWKVCVDRGAPLGDNCSSTVIHHP